MTAARLAQAAGVSAGYVSMLENGRLRRPPSEAVLRRIEGVLGLGSGRLAEPADVARAPEAVRARLSAADAQARGAGELAAWLREAARRRVNLDELLASGALGRAIERATGESIDQHGEADAGGGDGSGGKRAKPVVGVRVPLINRVAAGYPAGFTDLDYPARVADRYVDAPGVDDPDAFAATVCGESMLPDYREGDVVIFSPLAEVADGCDCFVRLEPDHESTFKRVYFEGDAKRVRLEPLNSAFETRTVDRERVAGMYRAVARYSKL